MSEMRLPPDFHRGETDLCRGFRAGVAIADDAGIEVVRDHKQNVGMPAEELSLLVAHLKKACGKRLPRAPRQMC